MCDAKNLFGIRGRGPTGSVRVSTREYLNGKWVIVDAELSKYESFEQRITEHARLFLRNRGLCPYPPIQGRSRHIRPRDPQAGCGGTICTGSTVETRIRFPAEVGASQGARSADTRPGSVSPPW